MRETLIDDNGDMNSRLFYSILIPIPGEKTTSPETRKAYRFNTDIHLRFEEIQGKTLQKAPRLSTYIKTVTNSSRDTIIHQDDKDNVNRSSKMFSRTERIESKWFLIVA
jgi:hypothetical protein